MLACQFEVGGGGPPTTAWYGLSYAGEVGRRVPVPLFQSAEDRVVFGVLVGLGPRLVRRAGRSGVVMAAGVGLWGLGRFFDQLLWFSRGAGIGADLTEAAGLALAVAGLAGAAWLLLRSPRSAPFSSVHSSAGDPPRSRLASLLHPGPGSGRLGVRPYGAGSVTSGHRGRLDRARPAPAGNTAPAAGKTP